MNKSINLFIFDTTLTNVEYTLKKELIASKNLQLIFVPNQYVKHYEFIRELINKFNGDLYQASLFDGYEDAINS